MAVYVEHNKITVPLGYDKGPARSGRGDLYSSDGISWSTMKDSGTDIDANWNISIGLSPYAPASSAKARKQGALALAFKPKANASAAPLKVAHVAQGATSQKNAFLGYNVYLNGDKLNRRLISGNSYTDKSAVVGNYLEYQVAASYSVTGEQYSNKVTLVVTSIDGVTADKLKVTVAGSTLRIVGAHTGDKVAVYAADGKLVVNSVVTDDYVQNISLSSLTTGTYIVKVGHDTVKVRVSRR